MHFLPINFFFIIQRLFYVTKTYYPHPTPPLPSRIPPSQPSSLSCPMYINPCKYSKCIWLWLVTNQFLTLKNFIHKSLHSSHECWSSSIVLFPDQIISIIIIIFQFLCFDRKRNSYSVLVLDHTSMKSQAAFLQQLLFVPQLSSQ